MAIEILYLLFNHQVSLKYLMVNSCLNNRHKMSMELHLFTQNHNSLRNLHTFEIDFVKKLRYIRNWKREDILLTELLSKMSQISVNLRKIRIEIPRDFRE